MRHMLAVVCLLAPLAAAAQGVQTGTLRGTVITPDGLTLPGATVTISSPALQGQRDAVTETSGDYTFRGLPPGEYDVAFSLSGMTTVQRKATVPLGGASEVNVTMAPAGVTEVVEVVGQRQTILTTPTVGANITHDTIDALATPRTLAGIASLSPGLTLNAPNPGPTEGQNQLVINGAFAFDNVFMLNGVDINDNLFAWPQNVFIEDAIAETQVLTSGISAEYGRFGGGVVNAITKSGGNLFSGSYRLNLANDAWSTETPFEQTNSITRVSKVNTVHEGTFGGPIAKDRLWFFLAGRYTDSQRANTLPFTAAQYATTDNNKRGEAKVTATWESKHTVQASVLGNPREQRNQPNFTGSIATIDPFALSDKHRQNHLFVANYKGTVNPRMLVEAQYSQQKFKTDLGGGTSATIVDSPFLTPDQTRQYNAPYFDASDPDGRNNRQLTGSASYFRGQHELKSGYEWFRSQHVGGNSQARTGYVFVANYVADASGAPVLDSGGRLMPMFVPGETQVFHYIATTGAVLDIDHHSAYAQDHWKVGRRVSADLGVRLEHVGSSATGARSGVNTTRAVPRLAMAFDPQANGQFVFHGTYSHYSGRYNDALIGSNSPVGFPIEIDGIYAGPAGQGRSFAAGFNPANYSYENVFALFPSANVFYESGLASPLTREFTASAGVQTGRNGSAQLTYVWRRTGGIIEDRIDRTTGTTGVSQDGVTLTLTNRVFENSDAPRREYQGLLLQGSASVRDNWTLNGHWTVQLKNDGNYEGEASNQILTSQIADFPEIFSEPRHYPAGRLPGFQRSKIDVWSVYSFSAGRGGGGSISGLWRYNSGRVYTLRALNQGISAIQRGILATAGYPDAPLVQSVYYSALGSESFSGYGMFDTSFNYDVPVFRDLRPWVKLDVFNLFNNDKLVSWNTSIRQDAATPRDALGLREGYVKGAFFGQGTGNANYPIPFAGQTGGRTLRVALGVRF